MAHMKSRIKVLVCAKSSDQGMPVGTENLHDVVMKRPVGERSHRRCCRISIHSPSHSQPKNITIHSAHSRACTGAAGGDRQLDSQLQASVMYCFVFYVLVRLRFLVGWQTRERGLI